MRAGPAISAVGLAYDLNFDGWDEEFRHKVAVAIQDNPFTASISAQGPIMPSCNHYGAAVGGARTDFCMGFGICPSEYIPALKWVYNHQVEPGPAKTFDILDDPHQAVYALANWPMDVPEKSPADQPELFPRVVHDTAAGYIIFRNGWSEAGQDICVSALLGTHPTHQNGRGMASGGSIYVYGKGLGWAGDHARYRFPGIFLRMLSDLHEV